MVDPISKPNGQDNSFPGFPTDNTFPGFTGGGGFRKETDEQCEQVTVNDVCVNRCVAVTSIFLGDTLIDESSRVTQSSCLNKRQDAKQNQ
jgi:hypothetical protein